MKDKEKTEIILNTLINNNTTYGRSRSRVLFPELRLGAGYCGVAQRRIDLFVIDSGAGNTTISYEIKVSRQDFKHDIDNDLKQRGARLYSNYFYYVTPKGLLKPEEIPLWAGLLEIDFDKLEQGSSCIRETVPAPLHPKATPSWGLICSMIRHVNKDNGKQRIADLEQENKVLNNNLKRAKNVLKRLINKQPVQGWELTEYQ